MMDASIFKSARSERYERHELMEFARACIVISPQTDSNENLRANFQVRQQSLVTRGR